MTGFLIYDWIEQPKKQEIIQEVLKLLEQKVLEPHSGEWQCAVSVFTCLHGPAHCISIMVVACIASRRSAKVVVYCHWVMPATNWSRQQAELFTVDPG